MTSVSEDGSKARVLVEYLRLVRARDQAAIQSEAAPDLDGVEAVAIPGIQVGDEVLVDLRPWPVVRLSFLYFGAPLLAAGAGAMAGWLGAGVVGLGMGAGAVVQLVLAGAGGVASYRYAEGVRGGLEAEGIGTPLVTAIMPRLMSREDGAVDSDRVCLQTVFPLTGPAPEEAWAFAEEEMLRVVGIEAVSLREDRVEVLYQARILKEKHLMELLMAFGIPVSLDRELED